MFSRLLLFRQSVLRRSVLWESTVPVMVPLYVKWSRKWKSHNTLNILAVSAERLVISSSISKAWWILYLRAKYSYWSWLNSSSNLFIYLSGCHETYLCWDLVMQKVSPYCSWGCLGVLNNSCCHSAICSQTFEGIERTVNSVWHLPIFHFLNTKFKASKKVFFLFLSGS